MEGERRAKGRDGERRRKKPREAQGRREAVRERGSKGRESDGAENRAPHLRAEREKR